MGWRGGVDGIKLKVHLIGQNGTHCFLSLPFHPFISTAHMRNAAAKIKTSSSDSLSTQ